MGKYFGFYIKSLLSMPIISAKNNKRTSKFPCIITSSLLKKIKIYILVNIAFVVFIDGQDTLFKMYVYEPLVITTPILQQGDRESFIHYIWELMKVDAFRTFLPPPFCTCHFAIYCYAKFLPFVIYIDNIVKTTIIIIKIMIYVTAFRHTCESFITFCIRKYKVSIEYVFE